LILPMSFRSQERLNKTMERKNMIIRSITPMERRMCLQTRVMSMSCPRKSGA
jgi:hypothetical protein